jgi:hypothetical protein
MLSDDLEEELVSLRNRMNSSEDLNGGNVRPKMSAAFKRKMENEKNLSVAVASLAESLSKSQQPGAQVEDDEWDLFGALVAKKIRRLNDPLIQMQAESEINSVLTTKLAEARGYAVVTVSTD